MHCEVKDKNSDFLEIILCLFHKKPYTLRGQTFLRKTMDLIPESSENSGNVISCGGASQTDTTNHSERVGERSSAQQSTGEENRIFSCPQVGPTPLVRPPLRYCGPAQRAPFLIPEVSQNNVGQQQQLSWTPSASYTAPNPYYGGFYRFTADPLPQIAQLQQSIKSLEERLTSRSNPRPNKLPKTRSEQSVTCVSDSETLYSDVSSGDDLSVSDNDQCSDHDIGQAFKDLKSTSSVKAITSDPVPGTSKQNIGKLQKLSKEFEAKDDFSEKVNSHLAETINAGIKSAHSQSACKDPMKRYLVPRNCEWVRVPLINPELWNSENFNEPYRSNDKMLFKNQKITTKAMLPIIQIMNKCLEDDSHSEIFDLACDAFHLLAYGHRDMSHTRRQFLKPAVSKQYRKLCQTSVPVTEHLFGDDLQKQMRELNEAHKFTQDLAGRKSKF